MYHGFLIEFIFLIFYADDNGQKICGVNLGIAEECHPGDTKEEQFRFVV